MKIYNQYTDDFNRYREENGVDPFIKYRDESTSDEERKEIEDWFFSLLREKNTIPQAILTDSQNMMELKRLSDIDINSVYKDGEYRFHTSGLTFLTQFFPEMNDVRKGAGRDHPTVNEYFHDDYMLRKCVRKTLKFADSELGLLGWIKLGGAGYCTNFRPAAVLALYNIFGKKEDCKVFDSSAGYGSRLLGAHLASNVTEYLGIDPNTANSCNKLIEYLKDNFDTGTKEQVLEMGSEDFTPENFPQYQNYFDLYFTSPPYFDTERYSDGETQSYKKFPTYKGWIKGFYQETIHNACCSLKSDGVFTINIFEKVSNIKELTKLFLADNGWYVIREDKYLLRISPGSNHRLDEEGNPIIRDRTIGTSYEPIWVAKHYSQLYKDGLIDKDRALKYRERASRDNKNVDL